VCGLRLVVANLECDISRYMQRARDQQPTRSAGVRSVCAESMGAGPAGAGIRAVEQRAHD